MDNINQTNNKLNIYLMYSIIFLQGFVFYGPIATLYRQNRGLLMYQIFLIESVFMMLMLVFEIPWGWFADRFGYKKTFVISNLIFFISKIVFYKAYTFWMFLVERILLAISISGLSGCDSAFIYTSVEEGDSEKAFGIYNALGAAGFLIACLAASVIVKYSFDKTAFYTIFPYGLAAILTLFLKDIKADSSEKPRIIDSFKNVFNNKKIIYLVISIAFIREVFQSISVFLNQLQYIRCNIDIKYFGVLTVVIQVAGLISIKAYKFSGKFGKISTLNYLLLLIISSSFVLIFTNSSIITVILIVLIVGAMAVIHPIILDIQNKAIITKDRATILSIYAMVADVVAAIINPIIGITADISVRIAFLTCVIIGIFGYGFFLLYKNAV